MIEIFAITLPIYLIAALGFVLVRTGVFGDRDLQAFSRFVVTIALPALLFSAIADRQFSEVFDAYYLIVYALSGLGMLALVAVLSLGIRKDGIGMASVIAMGSTMSNNGFVGYPILLLAFEDIATRVLALNFLVESILILPLLLIGLESGKVAGAQGRDLFLRVGKRMVTNPILIAVFLGLALSATGVALPAPVMRASDLLAAVASGVALIVIGGSLAGIGLRQVDPLVAPIVLAKLIIHPALVFALLALGPMLGLGTIDPALRPAVILAAAMPAIATYPAFVNSYGKSGLAATVVVLGVVLSFFTVTTILWFVS